jgi:hypothetical protein
MTAGGQEVAAFPVSMMWGPYILVPKHVAVNIKLLLAVLTGGAGNSYFSLQICITSNRLYAHCKSEFWWD